MSPSISVVNILSGDSLRVLLQDDLQTFRMSLEDGRIGIWDVNELGVNLFLVRSVQALTTLWDDEVR